MASSVTICNLALARIGSREFIDDLEEATTQAEVCKAIFDTCRDGLLEALWWPFATMHADLSLLTSVTRSGWAYAYTFPADGLVARYIYSGVRVPLASQRIPFAIESNDNGDGKLVLCDLLDAELVYTKAITAESVFSALFSETLAWKLAIELSMSLPNKADYRAQAAAGFKAAFATAAAVALSEGQEITPDSEFIQGRG